MRKLVALIAPLVLAGCPSPVPTSPEKPPTAEASPVQKKASTPRPGAAVDFKGTWTTVDDKGQVFDIMVFPNGQAVSNWTKGSEGARGERGFWRVENGRLIVMYDDGWTDILESSETGFVHKGFSPGTSMGSAPTNQAEAKRVEGPEFQTVGVWRLNKEPDGSYLYLTIQSNGVAVSTVNGGTEGKWEHSEKGTLCTWPDGWVDIIERTSEGWQKRSWVGTETESPADLSPATRVGETRYLITP